MSIFSPKAHFLAFRELTELLTRHRQLTWEMTRREIADRYVGQVFGILWTVGHPLLQMAVYIFVFAFVFRIRVGGTVDMPLDYTTYLLCGLVPWLAFVEAMSRGTISVVTNASLVKQVVFPIEILPVKGSLAALLTLGIFILLLMAYVLISHGSLLWTYVLLPPLLVFQVLGMIGVSFVLSSVGTYFRDLKDFVQVFCIVGMYVMPIFYLPSMVPRIFLPVLYANPFSYMIWCYQDACYFGRIEHPYAWVVFPLLCLMSFYGGYRVFRKLKPFFGNIL